MAKIQTRPLETPETEAQLAHLRDILHNVTSGLIGDKTAQVYAGDDFDEIVGHMENAFIAIGTACADLRDDLREVVRDNLILAARLDEAVETIEEFLDVSYDDALDHATADIMDALCATGAAEINHDGSLAWDERVVMSKSDLKPVIKQGIDRWVELKSR